jgi:large subunit ribosomal protein L13e
MTAAGNHVIPNVHFRKVNGMQHGRHNRVMMRTWLDQAGRKKRRANNRKAKAAKLSPRPAAGLLRPVVHPPTQRYNMKLRLGKGFTLDELREAKISVKLAPTIGIAVDHRRRNRCQESLQANVNRLKLYKSKLLVFPAKSGKKGVKKGDTPKSELTNVAQNTLKEIIPVERPALRVKSRAITGEEKDEKYSAYKMLKKARSNKHYLGAKMKKAKEAAEGEKNK